MVGPQSLPCDSRPFSSQHLPRQPPSCWRSWPSPSSAAPHPATYPPGPAVSVSRLQPPLRTVRLEFSGQSRRHHHVPGRSHRLHRRFRRRHHPRQLEERHPHSNIRTPPRPHRRPCPRPGRRLRRHRRPRRNRRHLAHHRPRRTNSPVRLPAADHHPNFRQRFHPRRHPRRWLRFNL